MRCLVPPQCPTREYWPTPHLQWPCFIYSRPLPSFPHPCLLISSPNTSSIPHGNIVPSSAQLSQVAGTPNDVCFVFQFYFIILSFTRLRYGVQVSSNACSWKYHIFPGTSPTAESSLSCKAPYFGWFFSQEREARQQCPTQSISYNRRGLNLNCQERSNSFPGCSWAPG